MNEITLQKARDYAISLFRNNGYDAVETGLGYKNTNGVLTDKKCLRFGVNSKKPLKELDPSKIIPKIIDIDGEQIETDVYEIVGINEAMPSYCNDSGGVAVPMPLAPEPVRSNRSFSRPLSGGMSGGNPPKSGFVGTGTLGGMVVDTMDGTIVGMTNCHVGAVAGGSDPQAGIPMTIASDSTFGAKASAYSNVSFYSPSSWDTYPTMNSSTHLVGSLKRAMPFRDVGNNIMDVALINLNNSVVDSTCWFPLCAPFNTPPDFATTSEINSLTINDPLFRSGRTLGPVGNGSCDIRITANSVNGNINFGSYTLYFIDMIQFDSPTTNVYVSSGGDSGSFVYGCINSTNPVTSAWKVVGLLHAGNATSNYGLACRIDNISNMFKVSAYKGESRSANPPLSSTVILPYSTYSNEVSAVIGGKTYWNMGRI